MKIRWFFHLLFRALLERRAQTLLIVLALALAAGLATSLVGLTFGVREKLGEELRIYGANFLINPKITPIGSGGIEFGQVAEEAYLAESRMKLILSDFQREIASYSFKLNGMAQFKQEAIPICGIYFNQLKSLGGGWKIDGKLPKNSSEVLVGASFAERFKIAKGDYLRVATKTKRKNLKVTGIIETGGVEDKSILMNLAEAQDFLSLPDKISQVLINARSYRVSLEALAEHLSQKAPEIEPKTLRQVAKAEAELLDKILKLMLLVTISVILATGIAVINTFGAIVLERRQEVGLLKALGSTNSFIGGLFLAEGIVMSLGSALVGFLTGILLAELFALSAFSSWVALPRMLIFVALGTSITIGIIASLGPVSSALKIDPAITLRGL